MNKSPGKIVIASLPVIFYAVLFTFCSFNSTNEFVFTMNSKPVKAGSFHTNGAYTFSFNFKSDTAFCRKRSATFFEFGNNKAYIEYPYLIFKSNDDAWKIMLDGTLGFAAIDDRTFHKLTFRINETQKDFLLDSVLVESKATRGVNQITSDLWLSSANEIDRLSGTITNVSFQPMFVKIPTEVAMPSGVLDSLDYPVGYVPLSNDYTNVHSVIEQLQKFPSPEYETACERMFSCYNFKYVAASENPSFDSLVSRAKQIQKILALKFNWGIRVSHNLNELYKDVEDNKTCLDCAMIELANELPDITADFTTAWAQLNSTSAIAKCNVKASTVNSGLQYFENDRMLYYRMGLTLKNMMHRPVNRHFENNEFLPSYNNFSDRQAASEAYTRYVNYTLDSLRSLFPRLQSTEYDIHDPSFYSSNGILFKERIKISNQGLGTIQFYPRIQNNWRLWDGDMRGLGFYLRSKDGEIKAGYPLNSPFVSAGWDKMEENNIRPSAYCGLLAILQVAGVKFFYPSYFTLNKTGVQEPKGYCWQMVIPAYVQASVSAYWKIITNGELLKGDVLTQYYLRPGQQPQYEYNFWSGDKEIFTVVRKLGNEYLIATAHQRLNNYKSTYPLNVTATIRLNGKLLSFESRPQGSIYYYNETSGDLKLINKEIQYGHPERWN